MVDSVGLRALQQNASAVVARAAGGEIVEITDRGRPVARLVPLHRGGLASLVEAGLARPAGRRLADLPPALAALPEATASLGDLLAQARNEER
jgi:prevent-host-death family protein